MSTPTFSMKELIEAGVHFGHKTRRWNPQMAPFIFGVRNSTHIIDLGQTVPMLHRALTAVREVAAAGGKILFVGTKRQASDIVAEAARDCNQYYINQRWLGGLMTNWKTIQESIKRLRKIEEQLSDPVVLQALTKKEQLTLSRNRDKLERSLGGIKDIGGQPDMLFIIDTNREDLAVAEANTLNIPIVGIVDTNATIEGISFPIPGNDDATRAINLYCRLVSEAVKMGRESAGLSNEPAEVISFKAKEAVVEAPAKEEAEAPKKPADKKATSKTKKESLADIGKGVKEAKEAEEAKEKKPAKKAPAKKAAAKKPAAKKPAAKKDDADKAKAAKEEKPKKAAAKKAAPKKAATKKAAGE